MAATAHGEPTKQALNRLAIRFALLAAKREADAEGVDTKAHQDQSELDKLIQLAEQAAADQPDLVRALADIIKAVAESDADPNLVMGGLVEGVVHTLASHIPNGRQEDTAGALVQLLIDRLRANGFLS
jgi:hypothetical protein